jgi:AcrR family transcriptional regulator
LAPPRKHDTDLILDAARSLALRDGPRAASVAAIANESGAPAGTLYHRFGSRDGILAAAWTRALARFQVRALEASQAEDDLAAAVGMALATIRFAREAPDDARLLLSLRRDDLLDADPGEELRERLAAMNAPLEAQLRRVARGLLGRADARAMDRVARAVVDVPYAAVRRHAGRVPAWLAPDVERDVRALLAEPRGPGTSS